jgi:hypothetical protein
MLRKDLKPGTLFRYSESSSSDPALYWVKEQGKKPPVGAIVSIPIGGDYDEVVIVHSTPELTEAIDPAHYKALDPEPVDVIDAWDLSRWLAQVVKYVARAGKKPNNDAVTDLKKAHRYLSREIARLEGRRAWE